MDGWLYDRTSTTCKDNGCSNNSSGAVSGYWTDTHAGSSSIAWGVKFDGRLYTYGVTVTVFGVRPVIVVSKSTIS